MNDNANNSKMQFEQACFYVLLTSGMLKNNITYYFFFFVAVICQGPDEEPKWFRNFTYFQKI